jgi:hypothetical protein
VELVELVEVVVVTEKEIPLFIQQTIQIVKEMWAGLL